MVLTANLPISSGALDLVPVAITYNVFLDGLAARFPHNVFTITFSMDERGRGFSFAFWGEGAVDILNSVRDFWVYADSCGLKTAFLGNGGRNAATIFSLRYSSSR